MRTVTEKSSLGKAEHAKDEKEVKGEWKGTNKRWKCSGEGPIGKGGNAAVRDQQGKGGNAALRDLQGKAEMQ